jgi:hypothetical protein
VRRLLPTIFLDYLPWEQSPNNTIDRVISINGSAFTVRSDLQLDHTSHFCKNLDLKSGECQIYQMRPFTCDFELIRFLVPRGGPIHLTQELFGRGWAMTRVDGGRGAKCEMTAPSDFSKDELIRKFERLALWAHYFHIVTCVDDVITWIRSGPHTSPLLLGA